jgi:EAL domain-containing protein (putative c-di-GMP-specific phosphodiesterase class I)
VNVSARNLLDNKLVAQIADLLEYHKLTPNMLVLEVTESAIMPDVNAARTILLQLHAMGPGVQSASPPGTSSCEAANESN